jgi:hypothetical protein
MIDPTVLQATGIRRVVPVFEETVASHATVSSNARVWPASCRAHGTEVTVTPCSRHLTRGAWASYGRLHGPQVQGAAPPPA